MPRKHRTLTEDHKGTDRFAVQLFSCPYLRKSAFICGLSRRRLCGGGFVCNSRAFAVRFSSSFFWGFWYTHRDERLFVRLGDRNHCRASGGVSLYFVWGCAGCDEVAAAAVLAEGCRDCDRETGRKRGPQGEAASPH